MFKYYIKPNVMERLFGSANVPMAINAIQLTFGDRKGDYVVRVSVKEVYLCNKSQFEYTYERFLL